MQKSSRKSILNIIIADTGPVIAQPKKKVKELKVIDPKASQNLGILLNSSLKGMSFEDLRASILACDDSSLGWYFECLFKSFNIHLLYNITN